MALPNTECPECGAQDVYLEPGSGGYHCRTCGADLEEVET